MNQDFLGLKIVSEQQTITPSIQIRFESPTIAWSSTNLTFQETGLTTSTLFKEAKDAATQDTELSFNVVSGNLNSVVLSHKAFAETLIQDESSIITKFPLQSREPILTAFLASGRQLSFKPTDLHGAVFKRVHELMDLATEDEIEMSPSSFWDLWSFISTRPSAPVPNVFALDNGNFRAVWKNSEGERVALEFRGSQIVGFVIFEYDRSLNKMMRMAGMQVLDRVQTHIAAAQVNHLLAR
jgi:hypothetical protein